MLILVVLSFLLCNLPYHARKMWQVRLLSAENMVYYQLFTPLTFLIMYFNSALNPILYVTMSLRYVGHTPTRYQIDFCLSTQPACLCSVFALSGREVDQTLARIYIPLYPYHKNAPKL